MGNPVDAEAEPDELRLYVDAGADVGPETPGDDESLWISMGIRELPQGNASLGLFTVRRAPIQPPEGAMAGAGL